MQENFVINTLEGRKNFTVNSLKTKQNNVMPSMKKNHDYFKEINTDSNSSESDFDDNDFKIDGDNNILNSSISDSEIKKAINQH